MHCIFIVFRYGGPARRACRARWPDRGDWFYQVWGQAKPATGSAQGCASIPCVRRCIHGPGRGHRWRACSTPSPRWWPGTRADLYSTVRGYSPPCIATYVSRQTFPAPTGTGHGSVDRRRPAGRHVTLRDGVGYRRYGTAKAGGRSTAAGRRPYARADRARPPYVHCSALAVCVAAAVRARKRNKTLCVRALEGRRSRHARADLTYKRGLHSETSPHRAETLYSNQIILCPGPNSGIFSSNSCEILRKKDCVET